MPSAFLTKITSEEILQVIVFFLINTSSDKGVLKP